MVRYVIYKGPTIWYLGVGLGFYLKKYSDWPFEWKKIFESHQLEKNNVYQIVGTFFISEPMACQLLGGFAPRPPLFYSIITHSFTLYPNTGQNGIISIIFSRFLKYWTFSTKWARFNGAFLNKLPWNTAVSCGILLSSSFSPAFEVISSNLQYW